MKPTGQIKNDQQAVIKAMSQRSFYPSSPLDVDRIDTHAAMLFLAGTDVYKIKKSVKFPYMDFSTLEKRRKVCQREMEINSRYAPGIYLGSVPITLEDDGSLKLNGSGEPVEWAVHMRRFSRSEILLELAEHGQISNHLIKSLAHVIANDHKSSAPRPGAGGAKAMKLIADLLCEAFASMADIFMPPSVDVFQKQISGELKRVSGLLDERAARGWVRRCHGDLHLGNIVRIEAEPVLFDALEFDEDLATTDVLYELAFVLMDLWGHDLRSEANILLNRYLYHMGTQDHFDGLSTLPLFLACRSAIRAMVTAQHCLQSPPASAEIETAQLHFRNALEFLLPVPARLIAIGGLSGTGKSTLAAEIAVHIGCPPGAVHIRSDLERKLLFDAQETERLGPECYGADATRNTYDMVLNKTAAALKAGHCVVADAVFSEREMRRKIATICNDLDIPFIGLWLIAPEEQMIERVNARRGDASDSTAQVVCKQLSQNLDPVDWTEVDASGSPMATLISVQSILRRNNALQFDEDFAHRASLS